MLTQGIEGAEAGEKRRKIEQVEALLRLY